MRGHIVKRYKNSYTIVLNIGIDPITSKRKQQWISIKGTKKEAEKKLSELLNQLNMGTFMKPGKVTLKEFLERWIKDYQHNLSPRGFERYAGIISKHIIPSLGRIVLTQLRPEHIQNHYSTMLKDGLSSKTVNFHHSVLHVALQTALKWGLIARNPVDAVDPPRVHRKDMQTWDEGEIARFFEVAKNSPYYELFYLALFTGMRRSELLALRWLDVDFIYCQIYVNRSVHRLQDGTYIYTEPKSEKSRRTIALSPSVILLLKEYKEQQVLEHAMLGVSLNDNDLIFCRLDREPLRPNTVTHAWNVLAARAGLNVIRFHDARHTHASLMLKAGTHPKIVQERLGHSSIAMTLDTYSHVAPGLQEAAAEKFDNMVNPRRENRAVENVG
ncbi:tyrosine-type recombinase/integrase [Chloroflexota bacterium]